MNKLASSNILHSTIGLAGRINWPRNLLVFAEATWVTIAERAMISMLLAAKADASEAFRAPLAADVRQWFELEHDTATRAANSIRSHRRS
jgi:hypothetical protein